MSKGSRRGWERRGEARRAHRAATPRTAFHPLFYPHSFSKASFSFFPVSWHWLFSALICLHLLLPSQNMFQKVYSSLEPCILCQVVSGHTECGGLWALPLRLAHPGTITVHELSLSADSILPEIRECGRCPVDNSWIPQSK